MHTRVTLNMSLQLEFVGLTRDWFMGLKRGSWLWHSKMSMWHLAKEASLCIAGWSLVAKWQIATWQNGENIEITSSSCFHRSKLFFRGQKLAISQTKGGERVCKTSNNRNSNNNNNGNKSNNNIRWCASTLCWWKPLKTRQSTYWMEDDTMEVKEGLPGGRSFVFWYCGTTNDERPLLATHVFRHV